MSYKDVCTKRVWKDKDGKERVKWFKVGTLKVTDDGKEYLDLFMYPMTPFYVFDQKKNEAEPTETIDL